MYYKVPNRYKKLLLILLIPIFSFAYSPLIVDFIKTKQSQYDGSMIVKITNYSTDEIEVLKWNTPLEQQLNANIFNISLDGKNIKYLGRILKRAKPSRDDYTTFAAGESRNITLSLPQYYNMSKAGLYKINYKGIFKYKSKINKKTVAAKMLKNTLPTIEITFTPSQKKILSIQKLPTNYNGCSSAERNIIDTAHDEAISIARNASEVMDTTPQNTNAQRYHTWFGAQNAIRQNSVTTHFDNIYDALDNQNIRFDCTCTDDVYAYVYPNEPYTIYLCNIFWQVSTAGTDSQAGTIVHEMSHFSVVAGTDDHAYGKSDAQALAISDPQSAVDNADSHEYFSENTPFLSMDNFFEFAVTVSSIDTGVSLNDSIDSIGDKDLFSFVVPESKAYTFSTTGTLDTIGELYSSSYAQVIENDDVSASETNFSFTVTLVAGQTYYLSVRAYGNNVGGYELHISSSKSISEFVERFYVEILNRESDTEGLSSWINQLLEGTRAATDIAKGFINSAEFRGRGLNDEEYVTVLYKAFFNRAPDTFGLTGWLNQLASGASRDKVLDGFLGSLEFSNLAKEYGVKIALTDIEQFVSRFYEQCLLRIPDKDGLNSWATQLNNGSKSGADIARGFIFSQEFMQRGLSNEAYLHVLYRAFFAREADSSGFNYWLTQLNGGVSREEVLNGFLGAQEFVNLAKSYGINTN